MFWNTAKTWGGLEYTAASSETLLPLKGRGEFTTPGKWAGGSRGSYTRDCPPRLRERMQCSCHLAPSQDTCPWNPDNVVWHNDTAQATWRGHVYRSDLAESPSQDQSPRYDTNEPPGDSRPQPSSHPRGCQMEQKQWLFWALCKFQIHEEKKCGIKSPSFEVVCYTTTITDNQTENFL